MANDNMDWKFYFSTLSDNCLEEIVEYISKELDGRHAAEEWKKGKDKLKDLSLNKEDKEHAFLDIAAIKRYRRRRIGVGLYEVEYDRNKKSLQNPS